jgi:DNA-binding YbaB/EbfC family protein
VGGHVVSVSPPIFRSRAAAALDMMAARFRKGKAAMKDLGALMKQAQAMQEKLTEAQARLAEMTADGVAGAGMVKLTLQGSGALISVSIDDALLSAGEGEILADLLVAAHADAKRKLDAAQTETMKAIAGPFGAMPGFPGLS